MPTTWDYVIAERAKVLAQLRHGDGEWGAGRVFEPAERVARAVETDRQRGLVWVRHLLDDEGVRPVVLMLLGIDSWVLNAADTLVVRPWESLLEYADRIAAGTDTDVLAVAIAAIDDDMREGSDGQRGSLAEYESARRVLKGVAAQQLGDPPATSGVAGDRPTARVLRDALRALVGSTDGAGTAMRLMMRGPGNEPLAVRGALVQGRHGTALRGPAQLAAGPDGVGHRRDRAGTREPGRGPSDEGGVRDGPGPRHGDDGADARTSTAGVQREAPWRRAGQREGALTGGSGEAGT